MVQNEQLIGYALNLLEPAEHEAVKAAVLLQPQLAERLARLQQALAPLDAERDAALPPPGLAALAIGRLAEHLVASGQTPEPTPALAEPSIVPRLPARAWPAESAWEVGEPTTSSWRPIELLVASFLFMIAVGLGAAGVQKIRHTKQVLTCQNQMRQLHTALTTYSSVEQGRFPQVGSAAVPVAGDFAQELQRTGHLSSDRAASCPESPPMLPYAYTLGFRTSSGAIQGVTSASDDWTPVLADQPVPTVVPVGHLTGQNVLFVNGATRFITTPEIGSRQDNIYRNDAQLRRAGLHIHDTSLGTPYATP